MELRLYKTTDDDNVINKDLEFVKAMNINLKDSTDVSNPNLRLKLNIDDIGTFNYAEIETFNRKYFMRDIQNINNDIWLVRLECDVLETFKDEILNSYGDITKSISSGDYQDVPIRNNVTKEFMKYDSDVELVSKPVKIMSAIGGL